MLTLFEEKGLCFSRNQETPSKFSGKQKFSQVMTKFYLQRKQVYRHSTAATQVLPTKFNQYVILVNLKAIIQKKKMKSEQDRSNEKNMWDSGKMLDLYIYDYMKKRGFQDAAEIFAKEANVEMLRLVNSEEGLLMEWWKLLWPQFCSRVTNKAGENPHSSAQPTMQNLLAMLGTLKNSGADGSQEPPTGNQQQIVVPAPVIKQKAKNQANEQMIGGGSMLSVTNFMGQNVLKTRSAISKRRADKRPLNTDTSSIQGLSVAQAFEDEPVTNVMGQSVFKTHSAISKRRADKRPLNTDTSSIQGLSAAQAFENEPVRYFPVQLLPTRNTTVPPSGKPSHLQMPVPLSPPTQAAKAPRIDVSGVRSVQVESACPAEQGSTYPPGTSST